jgi:hypothetical protein
MADGHIGRQSTSMHFNVEHAMRAAEEELLTRKQGAKESVRDFISQLRFLARKAYGQDLEKREAAVVKRLELGLGTPSLRRTYGDMIGQPGVKLSVLTAELVRRESRDDPGRYTQFVAQEREVENAKKPNNPSTATQVREIVQEVLLAQNGGDEGGATGGVNATRGWRANRETHQHREAARLREVAVKDAEEGGGQEEEEQAKTGETQKLCVGIATKSVTTAPAAPAPVLRRKKNGRNKPTKQGRPGRNGK